MTLTQLVATFAFGALAARNDFYNSNQRVEPSFNVATNDTHNVAPTLPATVSEPAPSNEPALDVFRSFIDEVVDFTPGVCMAFPLIRINFADFVARHGLPKMSDRALSSGLITRGCTRIHPDDKGYPRARHPRRPVLIVFPDIVREE